MTRFFVALPAALILLFSHIGLSYAQDKAIGAPIQLGPRKLVPDAPVTPAPAADSQTTAAPTGTIVEGLADIDNEAIGLLGLSQGGLGNTMWAGTERSLVERLLPRLPASAQLPTARDLTRRLLLSAATPPAGQGAINLLAARAAGLMAMGDVAAAGALADAGPDGQSNPDLARVNVERRLLQSDVAGACSLANLVTETSVYWQKTQIFCHAAAGEADFATLGLDLLREQGVDDPAFLALTAKLNGDAPGELAAGPATPLTYALLLVTQTTPPDWFIPAASPAVLASLAVNPAIGLDHRLMAGERAERLGALPAAQLAELYRGLNLSSEQVAAAITAPGEVPGVTSLAAAYLAAREHAVPSARAEALRIAWGQARAQGDYPVMARLSVDLLAEIAPATSLAWFAADAARASLLTGQTDRALVWYRLARNEAAFDPDATAIEALSWPLLRLAFGERQEQLLSWDGSRVDAWLNARRLQHGATADGDAALLFALLAAQDEPIGSARWADLIIGGGDTATTLPDPALWFALNEAASAGRLAETVLLSLIALADGSILHQQGLILNLVVQSLRRVGLTDEAHALAVEAAILAGL